MAKLAIILVTLDNIDDEFASHRIESQEMPPKTLTMLFEALDLLVSSSLPSLSPSSQNNQCVAQMLDYVIGYYNQMMDANLTMYPIESTSICDVAALTGWTDPTTTVYAPNYKIV